MAAPQQLRFFNPDNPPQAWSKAETNGKLETIKAELKQTQMDRIKAHNLGKHGVRNEST